MFHWVGIYDVKQGGVGFIVHKSQVSTIIQIQSMDISIQSMEEWRTFFSKFNPNILLKLNKFMPPNQPMMTKRLI